MPSKLLFFICSTERRQDIHLHNYRNNSQFKSVFLKTCVLAKSHIKRVHLSDFPLPEKLFTFLHFFSSLSSFASADGRLTDPSPPSHLIDRLEIAMPSSPPSTDQPKVLRLESSFLQHYKLSLGLPAGRFGCICWLKAFKERNVTSVIILAYSPLQFEDARIRWLHCKTSATWQAAGRRLWEILQIGSITLSTTCKNALF